MSAGVVKIVHAADIHLDSPLRGLERYEGAPVERIRGATRAALSRLVDLCIAERAGLLLLAGDLFDGDWKDYSTGLFFADQMSRLRAADVRVFIVRGNHDAASQVKRHLTLPDNVHEASPLAPETLVYDSLGVAVHGQSFETRAVTDDLASGYPDAVPGMLNIGVLHTSATGRAGHEPYAPCTLDVLKSKGYDYWALGHVHEREVLCEAPWVVFCGNLQGRHARELGDKGATLIELRDGAIASVEHRSVDVVRFVRCEVDLTDVARGDEVPDRVRGEVERALSAAEGRALVIRVVLRGRTAAHAVLHAEHVHWVNEIRALANDVDGNVWIEKVKLETEPLLDQVSGVGRDDALGALEGTMRALRQDEAGLAELLAGFNELRHKLPPEVRSGEEGLVLEDPAWLIDALDEVEQLLMQRLLSVEGGE